jgi:hypothetical protein
MSNDLLEPCNARQEFWRPNVATLETAILAKEDGQKWELT